MSLEWNPDFYKTGYEGFERDQNFPTAEALEDYRRLLLQKTEQHVAFIERHSSSRPLRVFEIASGNGRLLVSLAQHKLLAYGLGIEIAHSRVAFAERWAREEKLLRVQNVAADALTFADYSGGSFDLAVCLTGAFNYFRSISETAPSTLLSRMHDALKPDGLLLLELYEVPPSRIEMLKLGQGRLRTWQPLPAEDRFAYYLDDYQYWADKQILRHGKIFIGRDGTIDAGREEVLAYYDESTIIDLVSSAGFKNIRIFGDFADTSYITGASSVMILLAQRASNNEGRG